MKYCYHCMTKIDDESAVFCPECGNKCSEHFAQSTELPAGTIIGGGRYMAGKSIGSGGFGITYVGRDLNINKKVLIKETFYSGIFFRNCYNTSSSNPLEVTYQSDISFDKIISKTRKECESLSKAESLDNIVKVYDFFAENNTAYIITEFIDGVTLSNKINNSGCYKWEELYSKIKPLIQSLAELHDMGILHRDIKPANIMLKPTKHSGDRFVLIDFGLAHSLSAPAAATTGLAFSPGYAPIEQRTFSGVEGTFIDVYSLAATIYFALTGETPQPISDSIDEIFPCLNLLTLNYGVPENVVLTLRSALNPDYKKRTQTIGEMLADFERVNSSTGDNCTLKKANFPEEPSGGLTVKDILSENHTDDDNTQNTKNPRSIKKKHNIIFAVIGFVVLIGVSSAYLIFGNPAPKPDNITTDTVSSAVSSIGKTPSSETVSTESQDGKAGNSSRKTTEPDESHSESKTESNHDKENQSPKSESSSSAASSESVSSKPEKRDEKIDYTDLVGRSRDTAIDVIEKSDIELSYLIYEYNSDYAYGYVFDEVFLEDGKKADLYISLGEKNDALTGEFAAIVDYEGVEAEIPDIFYLREERTLTGDKFYTHLDFPDIQDFVHFLVFDEYADYWTKEYVDEYYSTAYQQYSGAQNYRKYKIDGYDAISYSYTATDSNGVSFTQYDYYILMDDHTVEIDIRDCSGEYTEYLEYVANSIRIKK